MDQGDSVLADLINFPTFCKVVDQLFFVMLDGITSQDFVLFKKADFLILKLVNRHTK